jgi:capsular polysaccharide export protein
MAMGKDLRIQWPFRKLRGHPLLENLVGQLGFEGEPVSVGWGYRPSGRDAIRHAQGSKGRLLVMEDALVRSMKPGVGQVYGLVADSMGIYYDASGKSDLVTALNSGGRSGWMLPATEERAGVEALISRFRATRVSKYNWYPGDFRKTPLPETPGVMVVDQTKDDASLSYGGLVETDFDRMIQDALDEHPVATIYLRAHPDHRYRGKHSCFSPWVYADSRVKLLPPDLSPARCFQFCTEVYAGTSLMGMEALIHGLPVKTYGWNFYAGWGLTEDRCHSEVQARERRLDLPRLFEAAYLQYSHYFDPDSGEPCGLGRILDHIELQHSIAERNAGLKITVGWVPWKRSIAGDYFRSPGTELRHANSWAQAETLAEGRQDAKLLLWGAAALPETALMPVIRVEDGFLRSSGLGAAFHRPLSWVSDDLGIYFDPRTPSGLEILLETGGFSADEILASQELMEFLRDHRLTKYNVGGRVVAWHRKLAKGRKVILIPGQVELDASIKFGSPEIKSNLELLRAVRKAEPDAFLIFKAHPDLVAGARHGQILPAGLEDASDLAVTDGNVLDWLDLCDEVHTMTSTVGFEALIRQVPVVTYGMPFYAAWGLTTDRLACPRRTRKLTLEELVCGALVKYPRYLNPATGEFTTALKVTRLLTSAAAAGDQRAWYLKTISQLKKIWVKVARI